MTSSCHHSEIGPDFKLQMGVAWKNDDMQNLAMTVLKTSRN